VKILSKIPLGIKILPGRVELWAITPGGLAEVEHWHKMSDALCWLMKQGYADGGKLMSFERLCAVYEGMQLRTELTEYADLYDAAGVKIDED
jgi:hypothetical protein